MQAGLNLSIDKFKHDIIYENSVVNTFLLQTMWSKNKEFEQELIKLKYLYPKIKAESSWLSMDQLAHMLKYFASGENRPLDGSIVGF